MAVQLILSSLSSVLSFNAVICLLLCYCVGWAVYSRHIHPLHKIPGPYWASISRGWLMWRLRKGDMDRVQRALHAEHGPLVRIAPDELVCSDPEAIKIIYGLNSGFTKSSFYPPWCVKITKNPDLFSVVDEKLHSNRRRIVNNVYAMSTVLESEEYIDRCSELFIKRMQEYADAGAVVDIGLWFQMYAFDAIGELFFGHMFGFMQDREDHDSYIAALDALVPVTALAGVSPVYLQPIVPLATLLLPGSKTGSAISSLKHMISAAKSCIATRQQDMAENKEIRRDILARLFEIHRKKGEEVDFQLSDIEQEAFVALAAGSDTTAIALRAVLYYLLKHDWTYKRLLLELDSATRNGQLSKNVRYAEATQLPFLCAVIKEAMRLHPSVGLSMPRCVPEGGIEIANQRIPAGYVVGVNGAIVHYDTKVFGPDAAEFNPVRWLDKDAATAMDRYMIHFGAGSRTCIGKNISLSELHKLIPQLLRSFTIELANPNAEWVTEDVWFNKQSELHVRIKQRLDMEILIQFDGKKVG